ncbi:MAG: N-acetylneuraminate synthase family protein [Deltaproteobacteria bacterium]|nr:N-acetylneuraminate synthase family protein [Deltaproteobacteria bacterium]MBW2152215.1 N-acetylneuraminate synthase family protein [Deltaproteobacteria bacterium]
MNRFPTHIEIAGRLIGPGEPCYVIAEGGVNHFGEIEKALQLIELAATSGATAFKSQHYRTDRLVGPAAPEWRERLQSKELPDEAIKKMQQECMKRAITFLCTPHDDIALEFLVNVLDVPAIKIGSGEVENWPFLERIARCEKPVILSTGMYEIDQIRKAVRVMEENGCPALALLHCITSYPAEPADVNLKVMEQIREFFPGPVGYSDHTAGTAVALAAVALGADIIEKHITIDRDVPDAQDWKVACDPSNLARFIRDVREVEAARGGGLKILSEKEKHSLLWARKSLTLIKDLQAGEVITEKVLLAQRPGTGIPPSRIEAVVGKIAARPLKAGTILDFDALREQ